MAMPKDLGTKENRRFADVGSTDGMATATRTVQVVGLGTPIQGTSGNGAAGAPVTLTAALGKDCYLETAGDILVLFGGNVTASTFHFVVLGGRRRVFHLPETMTTCTAWGVGGAYSFVIVPFS